MQDQCTISPGRIEPMADAAVGEADESLTQSGLWSAERLNNVELETIRPGTQACHEPTLHAQIADMPTEPSSAWFHDRPSANISSFDPSIHGRDELAVSSILNGKRRLNVWRELHFSQRLVWGGRADGAHIISWILARPATSFRRKRARRTAVPVLNDGRSPGRTAFAIRHPRWG